MDSLSRRRNYSSRGKLSSNSTAALEGSSVAKVGELKRAVVAGTKSFSRDEIAVRVTRKGDQNKDAMASTASDWRYKNPLGSIEHNLNIG